MQQADQYAATGGANGVAEGDGAAVDVNPASIPAQLLTHGQGLGREGFIGLDQIQLGQTPARLIQAAAGGDTGPIPMIAGSTPALA